MAATTAIVHFAVSAFLAPFWACVAVLTMWFMTLLLYSYYGGQSPIESCFLPAVLTVLGGLGTVNVLKAIVVVISGGWDLVYSSAKWAFLRLLKIA